MLTIDGSQGEGGGQMLRTALSLAMITGIPFALETLRAKRKKPGLLRQHLTCMSAATQKTGAKVSGAEPGSRALTFDRGPIRGGDFECAIGSAGSTPLDFQTALKLLVALVGITLILAMLLMRGGLGQANKKARFGQMFSRNGAVNKLAAARIFLFGARDVWFVVGLPVFLSSVLGWTFWQSGGFLAVWVIGYGIVQSFAPRILGRGGAQVNEIKAAQHWALILGCITALIAVAVGIDVGKTTAVVGGLIVFGVAFAMNSSLHSYLILAYSDDDEVALDVGFYYSANAAGRLVGTLLSGVLYLWGGLDLALWGSASFVAIAWILTLRLPPLPENVSVPLASIEGAD